MQDFKIAVPSIFTDGIIDRFQLFTVENNENGDVNTLVAPGKAETDNQLRNVPSGTDLLVVEVNKHSSDAWRLYSKSVLPGPAADAANGASSDNSNNPLTANGLKVSSIAARQLALESSPSKEDPELWFSFCVNAGRKDMDG